jgi:cobyrinic acid a,c-diamide synthase
MLNRKNYRLIVIAATGSGTGKTSVTCGIIAYLRSLNLQVQPFKVGPDFLDPTWLSIASGRPCHNLDSWMTSGEYIIDLVDKAMQDADIGIVEGVMGLYDGASPENITGSTAEISRLLNTPVVLIGDAHGTSRSFAATMHGFVHFPDAPQIMGIIANKAGGQRHKDIITSALASCNLPPLIGTIPRNAFAPLPDRHLGLKTSYSEIDPCKRIQEIAAVCSSSLDMESLVSSLPSFHFKKKSAWLNDCIQTGNKIRIGYAFDDAFHFYYPDNINILNKLGADLISFSLLNDAAIPENLHGLYLGGGYPEEYAVKLSENQTMLQSVRTFAQSNKPIYAECGGMMYLGRSIKDSEMQRSAMAGILPVDTEMMTRRHTLGYCDAQLLHDCILGKKGYNLKGHEFHYSYIVDEHSIEPFQNCFSVRYRNGKITNCGLTYNNILASYIHLHWGNTPEAAENFLKVCRSHSEITN